MVDPEHFTNFNRTDRELEEMLIFAVCVAGKTALTIAPRVHALLYDDPKYNCRRNLDSPLFILEDMVKNGGKRVVVGKLKKHGLGKYATLYPAFRDIVRAFVDGPDPMTDPWHIRRVTVEQLETIHGIGPKTSRMFIMHSRPDQRYAALDTHVLKWLRAQGHDAPKETPSGKKYLRLEQIFLEEADKRNLSPTDLDLQIWVDYSSGSHKGEARKKPI